ncbi:hypothetical protein BZG36_03585 [Bifiguratus adelaidae]|uniref:BZIP domain-containing protein n=1 Tax=Bifiguratus adelaidae TaxID=1938954 RepID=A0A261XYP0_9FUNG|nr:hypothetical protein BZG36_03585 [Bifiguratus adelaidae]
MLPDLNLASPTPSSDDVEEQPRKGKPGRKPQPPNPALRKAQNRAAQKAFRKRRIEHMKQLEQDVGGYKGENMRLREENRELTLRVEDLSKEIRILKGLLGQEAQRRREAREKALNEANQTNKTFDLSQFQTNYANVPGLASGVESMSINIPATDDMSLPLFDNLAYPDLTGLDSTLFDNMAPLPPPPLLTNQAMQQASPSPDMLFLTPGAPKSPLNNVAGSAGTPGVQRSITTNPALFTNPNLVLETPGPAHLPQPIYEQYEELRGRILFLCKQFNTVIAPPTALQQLVPHDPRINLIPTAGSRDKLIVHQDSYDLTDCLSILMSSARYLGGDISDKRQWAFADVWCERYHFLVTGVTWNGRHERRWGGNHTSREPEPKQEEKEWVGQGGQIMLQQS